MALGPFNQKDYKLVHTVPGEIKMPRSLYDYRGPLWFDASYVAKDAEGNKYIDPGLICAKAKIAVDATYGDTWAIVPYSSSGSYGTGSDTPYGVLDVRLNATLGAEAVAVLYHGQLQQRNCYVYGQAKGVISNTIKTGLPDIDWVQL